MTDEHADPNVGQDPAGSHDAGGPDAAGGHGSTLAGHGAAAAHGAHAGGHDDMGLGPTDWTAWGVGVVGAVAGLIVAVCAAISTGAIPT